MPAPAGPNYHGWRRTDDGAALEAFWAGVSRVSLGSTGLTVPVGQTLTVAGTLTATGAVGGTTMRLSGAGFFGLGAAEDATIVSGVLTVTRPYVHVLPESSTSDTLDSIVYTGAAEGDYLQLAVEATNTITVDDAAIALGATSRVLAPGGSLLLQLNGAGVWEERAFSLTADHA